MKRKRVWRYFCDYCGKGGCAGGHIAKHEKGCTANPNRECGMCRETKGEQQPMTALLAALAQDAGEHMEDMRYSKTLTPIPHLRSLTENCPACILAAIRQSGLQKFQEGGAYHAFDFDYTEERDQLWYDYNSEQRENWVY